MSESKKKLVIIALAFIVGLSAGAGWGCLRLKSKEKVHQAELKKINYQLSRLQRQYTEDKSVQNALEEEKRQAREKLGKLEEENEGLKDRADLATSRNEKMAIRVNTLEQKNRKTFQTLQEREKELRETTRARQKLQAELKRVNQGFDRCARHNARLFSIANELVMRYENKGPVDALLKKEPVTQVRRVELEKLGREYREKIAKERMGTTKEKDKP